MKKIITVLLFVGCCVPLLASAETWNVTRSGNGQICHDTWIKYSGIKPNPEYFVGTLIEHGGSFSVTLFWSGDKKIFAEVTDFSQEKGTTCIYDGQLDSYNHVSGTYLCGKPNAKSTISTWNAAIKY